MLFHLGSDYFTASFLAKNNKTKMKNIYPRIFHLLFIRLRVGFEFGLGLGLGLVLE